MTNTKLTALIRNTFVLLTIGFSSAGFGSPASAPSPANLTSGQRECIGYFEFDLPAPAEYPYVPLRWLREIGSAPLQAAFAERLSAWNFGLEPYIDGKFRKLYISQLAPEDALAAFVTRLNADRASRNNQTAGSTLEPVPLWERSQDENVYTLFEDDVRRTIFYRWQRIFLIDFRDVPVSANVFQEFLTRLSARPTGLVPRSGACIPGFTVEDDLLPARMGISFRIQGHPEVVFYFRATAAPSDGRSANSDIHRTAQYSSFPMAAKIRAIGIADFEVDIAANRGKGRFFSIQRSVEIADSPAPDYGFVSYVLGDGMGKPGEAFDVELTAQSFNALSPTPLSEAQFKKLTLGIVATIRQRPHAFRAPR